jgi:dTDP-4-amino-4,6-dideoxygalactose transaminase
MVRHDDREGLARHLETRGVQTGIHYPVAMPFLKAYEYLGHRPEEFPNAFHNQSRILSLPMFPELSDAQRKHVVASIADFCARKR